MFDRRVAKIFLASNKRTWYVYSCFSRDVTDYANLVIRHVGVPRSEISHVNKREIWAISRFFTDNHATSQWIWTRRRLGKTQQSYPIAPDYVKGLKERYLAKISVIVVDPASIPIEQFNKECLPPMEVLDLVGYLVLETSHYTRKEFNAYKSLNASV